jgi:hypothetical protein
VLWVLIDIIVTRPMVEFARRAHTFE